MKVTTGKPILGGILGALAALMFILILTFGAILPPTQLVVWVLLGLGVLVGSLMLTVVVKRVKFITVAVIAVLMMVWGAVGIPSHFGTGELDGGCTLEGISSDATGLPIDDATPDETSASDPFEISPGGAIDWEGTTPGGFEGWDAWLAVDFGGFDIPVWNNSDPNTGKSPAESGTVDVGDELTNIEDTTGITLSGVFHLFGNMSSPDGNCNMDAYLVLPADGLFDGPILITLWVILIIIVIVLIVLMIPVCRIRRGLGVAGATAVAAAGGAAAGAKSPEDAVDEASDEADKTVDDAAKEAGAATNEPASGSGAKKPPAKKAPAKKPAATKAPAKKPANKKPPASK